MKKNIKIYQCKICGNLIYMIDDSGVNPICCGQPMAELKENNMDASQEKHVPAFEQNGTAVRINVGQAPHPMTEEHHIQWVLLLTTEGLYARRLYPTAAPVAEFRIQLDEDVTAVYAYCNIHGLFVNKI